MPSILRSIRWKLTAASLLAIGIPLVLISWFAADRLWHFYLLQLEQELNSKAGVISDGAAVILSPSSPDDDPGLAVIVDRWRRFSNMRVTIADAEGRVRASTVRTDVGESIDATRRPGMREALAGTPNSTVWKSPNFDYEDTMYVNLPVREGRLIVGAVRVAYSLKQIQQNVGRIQFTLLSSVALYALLIVALTLWISDTIARPVERLQHGAEQLAAGDLDHRIQVQGTNEVVQLGATLNQMAERLGKLEGLRRQYVSNVSHELRTPLAAIRGMAETLLQHSREDPLLPGRYLPRIIAQTERLARLASQLLDLAQLESGNLVSRFEPVALSEVAEEVLHTCGPAAAEKGVTLESDLSTLPSVRGDRDRLIQVFLNLVDNAVHQTPPGGEVRITGRWVGKQVVVTLSDTGPGIAAEHLPHLFERFYRVDRSRSRRGGGGTGLGLSIVRQIVEVHGGSITVESTLGQGTSFQLTLPLDPPRADAEA